MPEPHLRAMHRIVRILLALTGCGRLGAAPDDETPPAAPPPYVMQHEEPDACSIDACTLVTTEVVAVADTAILLDSKCPGDLSYGEVAAGVVAYVDDASRVEIPLVPEAPEDFRAPKGDSTTGSIAIYVKSTAQIVLGSREATLPARLRITRCA